mgnify:CR=1 FL=1
MNPERFQPNPLLESITPLLDAALQRTGHALCIIDGYCGAGKTTLAAELSAHYDGAAIIHMDDIPLMSTAITCADCCDTWDSFTVTKELEGFCIALTNTYTINQCTINIIDI